MNQDGVTILVGTTKGAFLISGGSDRQGWTVKGPFCNGWPINHIVGDPATGLLWAGGGGEWQAPASGARKTRVRLGKWPSSQRVSSTTGLPKILNSPL